MRLHSARVEFDTTTGTYVVDLTLEMRPSKKAPLIAADLFRMTGKEVEVVTDDGLEVDDGDSDQ